MIEKALTLMLWTTQVLDVVSTHIGLSVGLTEQNPNWSIYMIILKLVLPFMYYAFYNYTKKFCKGFLLTFHTILYITSCVLFSTWVIAVVIHNFTLIFNVLA
jgi:hypothetical protein